MKFLKVDLINDALDKLVNVSKFIKTESIKTENSYGKIVANDIISYENVPYFRRSTVDGYGVICKDTFAASETIPTFLKNKGYVDIGTLTDIIINEGECIEIPTGGMVPRNCDAVVMLEYTEILGNEISINKSVSHGENLLNIGDDIKTGQIIIEKGTKLNSYNIGALVSIGIMQVEVFKQPTATIFSTGTEIVSPNEKPQYGKIRDVNTYVLSNLATEQGYNVIYKEVLKDDDTLIEEKIREATKNSDIVLLSGGSSQGKKDNTAQIINKIASPGIFTQGLSLKPGKPTILAHDEVSQTIIVGLPGQPMSATVVFLLMFGNLLKRITHQLNDYPIIATLSTNISSDEGKLTFYLCTLSLSENNYIATPILTRSAHISTFSKACGYFLIDEKAEGLNKGQTVEVYKF